MHNWDWEILSTGTSVCVPPFIALLGIMAARKPQSKAAQKFIFGKLLWVVCALAVFNTFAQYMASAHHRVYDTDIARVYDERFNRERMIASRVQAATALKEYHEKGKWDLVTNSIDGLDLVLGVFDDLGYDEQHGRISADVVHQYFYEDLEGYYQGSLEYIANYQKADPTVFANIKPLFNDVVRVQIQKSGNVPRLTDADYLEYLCSEIELNKKK